MERSVEAEAAAHRPFEAWSGRLRTDPGSFLPAADDQEMVVDLGAGLRLRQRVAMRLGAPSVPGAGDAVAVPIDWQPVGRTRLLPAFRGELLAVPHGAAGLLVLRGHYEVPLGVVGGLLDRFRGNRIARRSVEVLVADLAHRVDAVASDRLPGPVYGELLRDRPDVRSGAIDRPPTSA